MTPKILRKTKRAVAVVLLGLLLGTVAAPAASSAADTSAVFWESASTWDWVSRPLDGVGDSPVVP